MRLRVIGAVGAAAALCAVPATASGLGSDHPDGHGGHGGHGGHPYTLAVYGDAPYGTTPSDTAEFQATPAFIRSINADRDVSTVVHAGDIHSGKQYCTQAYDQSIRALWNQYSDPLVYTPGDNEWTDCHKAAEGGGTYNAGTGQVDYVHDADGNLVDYAGGNPVDNLALVRSIFFPRAGQTIGHGRLGVLSQAQVDNSAHPTDSQYVENVLWARAGTVFVTINVPGGSNNDGDPWYGAPTASPSQQQEAANRTAADLRWLDRAFGYAHATHAGSVVVIDQADMWDPDGNPIEHLSGYDTLVDSVASHTAAFGKPVLLFEGDSHVYRSDNPLQSGAPCTGDEDVCSYDAALSHPGYDVANFHRVVVHGSTFPLEWLKLTVDPKAHHPTTATTFGPFSWERKPQPLP